MPRTGITGYDLLVSCPSDVDAFLDIIKSCVDSFNSRYGKDKNIYINVNHWSADSYPQSGGKPQELLNKQFIRKCDVAVAVFWKRFGTPTDKYGSGTEEEIEEMLNAGKQVFMYFLDSPICPSEIDTKQYEKVKAFRDKYKDNKGLCKVVKDKQDFQKEFSDNLEMYFSYIISGENDGITKKTRPVLKIYDAKSLSDNKYNLNYPNLCNRKLVVDKREEILLKIKNLQSSCLPKRTPVINDLSNQDSTSNDTNVSEIINNMYIKKLRESTNALTGILINAEICSKWKDVVKTFALNNGIELCEDFWNLGDLKEGTITLIYENGGDILEGIDDEKKRYSMLEELYWNIENYNEYITYFSTLEKYNYAKLVVSNIGNSVDEDIDVKLIIPKGCILKLNDFSVPGINIIKELLKMKFFECMFTIEENENIEKYRDYRDYPIQTPDPYPIYPFNRISASEEYNKNKRKYINLLEYIFCYKLFENQDNDILMFHIDYLKHNTKMAFPSVLIFKNVPEYIKYEITSKHVEEIQKGEIKFVKN